MNRILALIALFLAVGTTGLGGADDHSGLWNFRYDPLWVSGDAVLSDTFTMAIFQRGPDLFGACTGEEPEPWNGAVMGGIEGDDFWLEITAASPFRRSRMNGQFLDMGTMKGSFICSDEMGNGWRGLFVGQLMNPDPEFYEPALIEQPSQGTPVEITEDAERLRPREEDVEPIEEVAPSQKSQSRFHALGYTPDTVYPRPVM